MQGHFWGSQKSVVVINKDSQKSPSINKKRKKLKIKKNLKI